MARKNKKVAYTWRVQWAQPVDFGQVLLSGFSGVLASSTVNLITAAEMAEFDDNALVKRVVGTFYFFAQNKTDINAVLGEGALHAGIYVAEEGTNEVPNSPSAVQDIRWSWLRQWRWTGSGTPNEGGNFGKHDQSLGYITAAIDVGVNRRMREGDELKFSLSGSILSGADEWNIIGYRNLRILMEV